MILWHDDRHRLEEVQQNVATLLPASSFMLELKPAVVPTGILRNQLSGLPDLADACRTSISGASGRLAESGSRT